ncbi:MAG: DUF2780 domain-containing protein [Gammaproteobacteria bacterium]
MTLKRDINLCSLLSLILLVATSAAVPAVDLGLTGLLTSQLGVTEPQAMGGAGAMSSYAKEKLSPESFTNVANAVPEMDQLLGAAPAFAAPEPAGSAPGLGALATAPPSRGGCAMCKPGKRLRPSPIATCRMPAPSISPA